MPRKKKADPNPKFISCPACGGPIDYWNTCRQCGRAWTPELTETEKLELADKENTKDLTEEDEEEGVKGLGNRESALTRSEEELSGKVAKKLAPGAHPKGRVWEIEEGDSETVISRKRSLMRLDSRKIYNAMGLAVRAQEGQRGVLLWLSRLWEFLDEDDRRAFAPTAELLKKAMVELTKLRKAKVDAAVDMEKVVNREHNKARQIRYTTANVSGGKKKKVSKTKVTEPGADTEGFETAPLVDLDPDELMEQVKERMALRGGKVQSSQELEDEEDEN